MRHVPPAPRRGRSPRLRASLPHRSHPHRQSPLNPQPPNLLTLSTSSAPRRLFHHPPHHPLRRPRGARFRHRRGSNGARSPARALAAGSHARPHPGRHRPASVRRGDVSSPPSPSPAPPSSSPAWPPPSSTSASRSKPGASSSDCAPPGCRGKSSPSPSSRRFPSSYQLLPCCRFSPIFPSRPSSQIFSPSAHGSLLTRHSCSASSPSSPAS